MEAPVRVGVAPVPMSNGEWTFVAGEVVNIYGVDFIVHISVESVLYEDPDEMLARRYCVTDPLTGAKAGSGSTKTNAVDRTRIKLERVGADGFRKAQAKARASYKDFTGAQRPQFEVVDLEGKEAA